MFKIFKLDARGYFDKAEEHFEAFKDTSLPLPIWYQDRLTKQWKSGKLNYTERDMLGFLQMDSTKSVGSLFGRSAPGEPRAFKIEKKQRNAQEEEFLVQAMAT